MAFLKEEHENKVLRKMFVSKKLENLDCYITRKFVVYTGCQVVLKYGSLGRWDEMGKLGISSTEPSYYVYIANVGWFC
jgi:hypothetical protein